MDNASCSQAIYFLIRKWRNEGKKTNPHCNLPKWKKELPWVPRHEEGIHFGDFLVWSKAMNVNKTISTVCLFVCLYVSFLFFLLSVLTCACVVYVPWWSSKYNSPTHVHSLPPSRDSREWKNSWGSDSFTLSQLTTKITSWTIKQLQARTRG